MMRFSGKVILVLLVIMMFMLTGCKEMAGEAFFVPGNYEPGKPDPFVLIGAGETHEPEPQPGSGGYKDDWICGCWDVSVTCTDSNGNVVHIEDCTPGTCEGGECVYPPTTGNAEGEVAGTTPTLGGGIIYLLPDHPVDLGDSNTCKQKVFKRDFEITRQTGSQSNVRIEVSGVHPDYDKPIVTWDGKKIGTLRNGDNTFVVKSTTMRAIGKHTVRIIAQSREGTINLDDIVLEKVQIAGLEGDIVWVYRPDTCRFDSECEYIEDSMTKTVCLGSTADKYCGLKRCECGDEPYCVDQHNRNVCEHFEWELEAAPEGLVCLNGQWASTDTSDPSMAECEPGQEQCDGTHMQICNNQYNWEGTGQCCEGVTKCSDTKLFECVNGDWSDTGDCCGDQELCTFGNPEGLAYGHYYWYECSNGDWVPKRPYDDCSWGSPSAPHADAGIGYVSN